jgi:hypothetical protein
MDYIRKAKSGGNERPGLAVAYCGLFTRKSPTVLPNQISYNKTTLFYHLLVTTG